MADTTGEEKVNHQEKAIMSNVLVTCLHVYSRFIDRGQCFGYAFSGSRDKCPIKAGKWKYFFGGDQGRSFKVAGEGLVITTVPERNVPTCDAAGAGASSVAFDTIRDKDFQKEIWALAKQRYGSGGRAFLKVNMPEYVVLDGEVKGGLDADCEFVWELEEG